MRASNVLTANKWVKVNSARLKSGEFGSQQKASESATKELGFKVSVGVLRDLMKSQGIPTKRVSESKRTEDALRLKITTLEKQNLQMKKILARIKAAETIPDDLKNYILEGLDNDILEAIRSTF